MVTLNSSIKPVRACIRIEKAPIAYSVNLSYFLYQTLQVMIPTVKQRIIGIDVSKDTLAVCFSFADKLQHLEVSNNKVGFQKLVKQCGVESLYLMEATGIYYLQLAYYLFEQGAQVVVVNPVVIKRFIQMHL